MFEGKICAQSEELYGNELSYPVHINGLSGKSGRLEIIMNDAKIYAIGSDMLKRVQM